MALERKLEYNIGEMDYGLEIVNLDILEWSEKYTGEKFHALLTDSPYEYVFMGKSWDSSGVSFSTDTWSALGKHMLPGAFGMTYGGARTWHRIAVAIEDAGFIMHPTIFCWTYATGLHKAARIDTAIDKEAGAYEEREVIEKSVATYGYQKSGERWAKDHYVTRPATEEATMWWEYRYGIQALRPAVEPIILFQKPYDGKKLDSIRKHGAGALHIEPAKYSGGKWPTNFIVVHHPLCTENECHHSCNLIGSPQSEDYFHSFGWEYDTAEGASVMYGKKSLGLERTIAIDPPVGHPTMKPLAVNMWRGRLLLPPQNYSPRRLLVPFGGVMSESIAAILAGWEHVTSVEINSDYAVAGEARAKWWFEMSTKYGHNVEDILAALKAEQNDQPVQLWLNILGDDSQ